MNIKSAPCLARIVDPGSPYNQWIVRVIERAQPGLVQPPDGQVVIKLCRCPGWICESLQSPFVYRGLFFGDTLRPFDVIHDEDLRPLPGDDVDASKSEEVERLEAVPHG